MSIVGHGIDLVDVVRIQRMLDEHGERFRDRCFTRGELAAADATKRAAEFLAGRFAAKEATLKAIGTGLRHGIEWTDIEIIADAHGRPTISLSGQAERFALAVNARVWWVSITHVSGQAMASVVAES